MTKAQFKPTRITIHCSVTKNGETCDVATIRRWHLEKGWKDIGYHMVIQPDGEVQKGRPLNEQGAHVEGYNSNNIGICLIGTDLFTSKQFKALRYQLDSLHMNFDIEPWEVACHYEYDSAQKQGKTCPNINIRRLLIWYCLEIDEALKPYLLKEKSYYGKAT